MKGERGFTLIELMIAVTLVAAISTGMLLAMRTALLTLQKVESRLQDNRRVVSVQQMLVRQLSSVMPAVGDCGTSRGSLFLGTAQSLRMVTELLPRRRSARLSADLWIWKFCPILKADCG